MDSSQEPPYPCDNCSVDVVSAPLPPTPPDADAGSGTRGVRHGHHDPQQQRPRGTPPRRQQQERTQRGPSLEPSGCAGQARGASPPPPPPTLPLPPAPSATATDTATARWYCRECGETFCYGCVGALHAHGTRRAGHTRERIVPSPPPSFLTPLVRPATALVVLLLLRTLFFYERPGFLAGVAGAAAPVPDQAVYLASEHCPLATLCKRAAKQDMLLYYHLKPYLSDQCDVEDSVWGFFEDAWVRGLLLPAGRDSWYLLLVQCKHVAIGYAVALLASPLLCAPLAAAATLAALVEACTPACAATRAVERWATRPLARLLAVPLAAFASLGRLAAFSQALAWAAQLLPFGGGGSAAAAARDRRPPPLTDAFAPSSPWRHAARCYAHGYAVASAVFRETALAAAAAAFLVRVCGLAAAEWRLRASPLAAAMEAAAGWAGWGEALAAQRAAFVAVSEHAEPVSGLLEAVLRSLVGDLAGASSVPSACATGLVLFSVYQLTSGRGGWAWPASFSPGFLLSTLKEAVTG